VGGGKERERTKRRDGRDAVPRRADDDDAGGTCGIAATQFCWRYTSRAGQIAFLYCLISTKHLRSSRAFRLSPSNPSASSSRSLLMLALRMLPVPAVSIFILLCLASLAPLAIFVLLSYRYSRERRSSRLSLPLYLLSLPPPLF